MSKNETFKSFIQKNALQLTVQMVGLIVVIANLWLVYKLSPIQQDIAIIKRVVYANEEQHKDFVTKTELNLVIGRLDKISNRVDEIIAILIK